MYLNIAVGKKKKKSCIIGRNKLIEMLSKGAVATAADSDDGDNKLAHV